MRIPHLSRVQRRGYVMAEHDNIRNRKAPGGLLTAFAAIRDRKRQKDAKQGAAIAEQLASDLRTEFPGVAGFSVKNLWYMRQFYLEYSDHERLQPLVGEIAVQTD